jgi:hypothetical protein
MTTGTHRRSSDEGSGNTTIVHNGNSVSIITQSGEPSRAEVEIEKEPGRTFIYRRIGGNTTIIEPEHQRVVPRCFAGPEASGSANHGVIGAFSRKEL